MGFESHYGGNSWSGRPSFDSYFDDDPQPVEDPDLLEIAKEVERDLKAQDSARYLDSLKEGGEQPVHPPDSPPALIL